MPVPSSHNAFESAFDVALPPRGLGPKRPFDAASQVGHVNEMVEKGLKYLGVACSQLEQVEQELDAFLKGYYTQVGSYFEDLEKVKRQIGSYEKQIQQSSRRRLRKTDPEAQQVGEAVNELMRAFPKKPLDLQDDEELDRERKAIYRRLAKLYHPDVVKKKDRPYATEVLQLLGQVMERRNLWAMREMEHVLTERALGKDMPEVKLKRLRERFDAIASTITKVTERRKRLQASAAWELKSRMEKDSYLVEVVIHRAQKQLAEANQLLFRKKLEHQALMIG